MFATRTRCCVCRVQQQLRTRALSTFGGMSPEEFKCFVMSSRLLAGSRGAGASGATAVALTHLVEGELRLSWTSASGGLLPHAEESAGGEVEAGVEGKVAQLALPSQWTGVAAALIEHTAVMCAWTTLKDEFGIVSTADLRIDYLENITAASIIPGDVLHCEAKVFHRGSKLIRVEASVYNANQDKKIITGRGLFHVSQGSTSTAEGVRTYMKLLK